MILNKDKTEVFRCAPGLTSVTIPDSVTTIRKSAFSGCTSLASITIPDSVTEIGEGAFYGCTNLPSVMIPRRMAIITTTPDDEWELDDETIDDEAGMISMNGRACHNS